MRSLEVFPAAGTEDAWREARLRLVWDDDEAADADAGVDLPLGLAFGLVEGGRPYQSLLLGQRADSWYNRFPMPYHRQAILRIDSDKPLRGALQVRTVQGTAADAGFFRAALRESRPTRDKVDVEWLNENGRGHFAGVFLLTEGKAKLPFWLEGDDRFTVDGRLAIHGTGTEDYFNCGWYALPGRLDGPACYPLHGFPAYGHQGEAWRVAAYRWHLSDPVPYSRSIVAGIEHGGENNVSADYRAAVFWYSERPSVAARLSLSPTERVIHGTHFLSIASRIPSWLFASRLAVRAGRSSRVSPKRSRWPSTMPSVARENGKEPNPCIMANRRISAGPTSSARRPTSWAATPCPICWP